MKYIYIYIDLRIVSNYKFSLVNSVAGTWMMAESPTTG